MQNKACHFDGANHTDLFVYINSILTKEYSGQRDLPLLILKAAFLCATIRFHKHLEGIQMVESSQSNLGHERYVVNSAFGHYQSHLHMEAIQQLISLLVIKTELIRLRYTEHWAYLYVRNQTKCFRFSNGSILLDEWSPLLYSVLISPTMGEFITSW